MGLKFNPKTGNIENPRDTLSDLFVNKKKYYSPPSDKPEADSFTMLKKSEIGYLSKEQIIEACKEIYPEAFV